MQQIIAVGIHEWIWGIHKQSNFGHALDCLVQEKFKKKREKEKKKEEEKCDVICFPIRKGWGSLTYHEEFQNSKFYYVLTIFK